MAPASTRDRLLDSALERFAGDGVLSTTLDQVREAAGASVGAIYHHFPDKEALYDSVRERALADYQGAFGAELDGHEGAEVAIRGVVAFHFRWCGANQPAAKLLLSGRPSGAETMNVEFFGRIRNWWRPHVHYGAVRDLDFLLIYALWLGPSMEVTRNWLASRAPAPTKQQINALSDAAWTTLKEPRPR